MSGNDTMKSDVNFTIFGGTGDLTFRKLLPAFYNMSVSDHFANDFHILVIGRRTYEDADYREKMKSWVKEYARLPYREDDFEKFANRVGYYTMDFTKEDAYAGLGEYYKKQGLANHIFYFAVAPRFFDVIAQGLTHVEGSRLGKVVIEKPFGEDLASARVLNKHLEYCFKPENLYHIDHYLGKEMVRNIQAIRFMNPIFRDVWNKEHIDYVQISATENVGVESRGGYYDQSGALKDMVQNHLLQILSIVAMEEPQTFFGDDMQQLQVDVLHSLRKVDELAIEDTMLLGQYFQYQKEDQVAADSQTETYAALSLFVDNERWQGVPFYIRTGKKLREREMEVAIVFKRSLPEVEPDILVIKIQPTEGVFLRFNIKKPGDSEEIVTTSMDFCQSCSDVNRINTPEAYERLLMACVKGEASWFSKWEQIETSWQYIASLKERYLASKLPLATYPSDGDGPSEADALLAKHGHVWVKS